MVEQTGLPADHKFTVEDL